MKYKNAIYIVILLLFSSCFPAKIMVEKKQLSLNESSKILLLGAEINPYGKPIRVNTPEFWFNKKIYNNSEQIQNIAKSRIDVEHKLIEEHINNIFNSEIITTNSYTEALTQYKKTAIENEDKNFPLIFCSEKGIHPISYKRKEIRRLDEKLGNYQSELAKIATITKADAMVLFISEPKVWGVGAGGFVAKMQLDSYMYVFDSNGNLEAFIKGNSKPFNTNGKDVSDFIDALDEFKELSEKMMLKLK